jgi:hypothetical protein
MAGFYSAIDTRVEAATGFNRQYPIRYVIIHLVVLLQIACVC